MKIKMILSIGLFILNSSFLISQSFSLTVNDGYGTGNYEEGDTVHLWTKAVDDNHYFSHWSGTGLVGLIDGDEWHNRLVVPANSNIENVEITANYASFSEVEMGVDSFYLKGITSTGAEVDVYKLVHFGIPSDPKAMVLLFHGTGGSGASFFSRYERIQLVKELLVNGFAVFSVDANEATLGDINGDEHIRWDTKNSLIAEVHNNVDLHNMNLTLDSIIYEYDFDEAIPVFGLGMSNGANFGDLCASVLDFNAAAHITATGKDGTYVRDDIIPIIWIAAENDHQEFADFQVAKMHFEQAKEAKETSEFHVFRRSPVYPERFMRSINGIGMNKSKKVFDALADYGFIDDDHYFIELDTEIAYNEFLELNDEIGLTYKQKNSVKDQFLSVNADHVLHSDFTKNIIRFYDFHINPISSIVKIENEVSSRAYPNPFSTTTFIEFDNPQNLSYRFTLYDGRGQTMLMRENSSGDNIIVERGALSIGLYYYLIEFKGTSIVGELVVQ